jgi:hypothetical protein
MILLKYCSEAKQRFTSFTEENKNECYYKNYAAINQVAACHNREGRWAD